MWAVLFLRKTIARCNSRIQIITIEQSSEIVDMLFLTKSRKLQTKNLQLFAISDSTLYITALFLRRRIMDETAGEGVFRDRTKKIPTIAVTTSVFELPVIETS